MFPRYSGDTRPGPSDGETARLALSETPCPSCTSILTVFVRDGDQFRHTWSSELMYAPRDEGLEARHVDLIWPIWNVFDATPDGRGNESSFPALAYD